MYVNIRRYFGFNWCIVPSEKVNHFGRLIQGLLIFGCGKDSYELEKITNCIGKVIGNG